MTAPLRLFVIPLLAQVSLVADPAEEPPAVDPAQLLLSDRVGVWPASRHGTARVAGVAEQEVEVRAPSRTEL
jgi:hypothetical protein